ncbi:MAG: redoxin family protein, partial [Candidatus Sumerlaeota bacterium]|nr:redoxin family protein [Candidatus Sumerlaeota bacterium]
DDIIQWRTGDSQYMQQKRKADETIPGVLRSLAPGLGELLLNKPLAKSLSVPVWKGEETVEGRRAGAIELKSLAASEPARPVRYFLGVDDGVLLGSGIQIAMGGLAAEMRTELHGATRGEKLDPALFSTKPPEGYKNAAEGKEESPLVGQPIQDFSFVPVEGGAAVALSSFKGSPVILDFWATWCPPCRASLPFLNRAAALGKEKGLKVISVSDEAPKTVADFLAKNKLESIAFYIDKEKKGAELYKVEGIPTTLAIDAKGVIQGVEVGFGGPEGLQELVGKLGIQIKLGEEEAAAPGKEKKPTLEDAALQYLRGDHKAALATLKTIWESQPDDQGVAAEYFVALAEGGQKDEAAKVAKKMAEAAGDDPEKLNAAAYYMADYDIDLPAAEGYARKAVAAGEDSSRLDTLGWVLFKENKNPEAIESLKKAAESGVGAGMPNNPHAMSPEDGAVWYHLGRAYEAGGDTAQARIAYRKAVQTGLAPKDAQERLAALGGEEAPASAPASAPTEPAPNPAEGKK